MRKTFLGVTAVLALVIGASEAQIFLGNRDMQALPNTTSSNSTTNGTTTNQTVTPAGPEYTATTKSLKYYGNNITVPYTNKLGCGACINSGYTFCVQGKAW